MRKMTRMAAVLLVSCGAVAGGQILADGGGVGASGAADAAIVTACANYGPPETDCPVAPDAGVGANGVECLNSLPEGLECATTTPCHITVDPCPLCKLYGGSETYSGYVCACVAGHWACGVCFPGGSTCGVADAGD
jgi:hypothetical protein